MCSSNTRVLVIDDDHDIIELVARGFSKAGGFLVSTAFDGVAGLAKARAELPHLIILDLMLPRMSGLEIAKILKFTVTTRHIPILMLTAKAEEVDRIIGFEMGATDYVTKPFSPRELVLRAQAILQRDKNAAVDQKLEAGPIILDLARHSVTVGGAHVLLTGVEFRLLAELMQAQHRVLLRDQLLRDVWGYSRDIETRTVDTHIRRLRHKLGSAAYVIETVRGYGYRLNEGKQGRSRGP